MKIEVNVPNVATIAVTGPVGCGKSAVMRTLKKVLIEQFGATVLLNDELRREENSMPEEIAKHEADAVRKTVWLLAE
jgi:ABC-type polar amino acid transport system ATPase subunit